VITKGNRMFGAVLLVSGTTIGAGMLAMPVTTGRAGFFPSLAIMTAIWLFMLLTAFYFLEVNLRIQGESNLISMMHKTLGRLGEIVSWLIYLLLLYALSAAYLLGCSQILNQFFYGNFGWDVPAPIWTAFIFVFFAAFVYLGTEVTDYLNRMMMLGLVISYFILLGMGLFHVKLSMLSYHDWSYVLPSVSIVLTTFGYHIIIPTLVTYLEHDAKLLKRAIFFGSLIPFIIYLAWQFLVMGTVPVIGEKSLTEAAHQGLQITFYLTHFLINPWVGVAVKFFAFFAIVTSLLGVTLSLSDFLADGLKIKKTYKGKLVLILLTFIPPLIFALFYRRGFILALKYAGILVAILLALFPALMAWFERYGSRAESKFLESEFTVPGGKTVFILTILLALALIGIEVTL
jgi:tyrosine-specific transport protein